MLEELRVCAVRNGVATRYHVWSVDEAREMISCMAKFDLLSDEIDWNSFSLQVRNRKTILNQMKDGRFILDCGWEEWHDENDNDINGF